MILAPRSSLVWAEEFPRYTIHSTSGPSQLLGSMAYSSPTMDYATLLRWVHVPIAALFLLNLVCLALTVHSWLLSDWFIARSVETKPGSDGFNEKWGTIMVDYLSRSTDTTFISEFIALAAAIVCFLSWYKLRRRDMDMEYNQVLHSRQLCWIVHEWIITCV